MGDYREPWNVCLCEIDTGRTLALLQPDGEDGVDHLIASEDVRTFRPLPHNEVKRLLSRARKCVNAMEGIEDPAAFVSEAKAAMGGRS